MKEKTCLLEKLF